MQENKSIKLDFNAEYDKSDLLKPHKLIVSFGERSTLLYDNEEYSEVHGKIFKEAKRVIRTAILINSKEVVKRVNQEELYKIRNSRGVSFIFNMPLEAEAVYKLMNISSYPDIGIKSIDEIIVAQSLGKVYLYDTVQNILYEFGTEGIQNNLDFLISNLEKQPVVSSLYLDRIQPGMYGKNAVVPAKIVTKGIPVLSGQKELEAGDEIPESIAKFFNDEISSLSIIKNMDGTVVYTNREGQVVKLYTNGMLEYVNFDLKSDSDNIIDVRSAIDISTEFVSNHFSFPEDSYISDIIKSMKGDKYIIRYNYAHGGLPVLSASGMSSGSIEVEIVGDKVRRYKRTIRKLDHELEYKQVMGPVEVLDILLDEKVEALSGERIKKVNDMYLAYYERFGQNNITYVPVWVAEVTVERLDKGTVLNQRYIINAETGIILDK
ncbi:MAG: two-component system activity regulator YycH [Clostridiaceae bacterium]|jgi:regulatory protein YycI of two-component signal transduction system YycFG|nr:two-component system activity regulator YycH [Clostridiaceae bacterium]